MHIAVAGPISLDVLAKDAQTALGTTGYPFPMTAELSRAYIAAGHSVSVVTSATDVDVPRHWRESACLDVTVVPMRPRARSRALDLFAAEAAWVQSVIEDIAPDVVHAHWSYEFAAGALESRAPALVTVHDWAPAVFRQSRDTYRLLRWRLQRRVLSRSTHVSAPSQYISGHVTRAYGLPCPVIPNGLRLQDRVAQAAGTPTVAGLNAADGRLKNMDRLLRAWPLILTEHPEATLRLAGAPFGPDSATATWAQRQRLVANVEFVGPLAAGEVHAWLGEHALFVHPSLEESFGMVLIEAMAAGCAVVAGERSGAVPEVVGDAGLLVDVRKPEAIAAAVIDLLSDRQKRERYSESGRVRAAAFDIGSVAGRYLEEFERIRS